ncbi:MFS multidrug transporter [Talaromyces pinophilus]|uniref:MFS multidrug transporter n=1 Tax=Talaromyces pinophilus TaxID=128442 RepID=A0A6V8H1Y3_TALPI|nr:MFS multidrug transporter [Talaromyces pinophilus]
MEHQDETTPLLTNPHQAYIDDESTTSQETLSASSSQWRLLPDWSTTQWRVMIAAALLLLSINFGNFMAQPPQLQIFEDIICKNYVLSINATSNSAGTLDNVCKSPAVQKELALVTGWKNTFDTLPSVALALPFGILADRIGRRPVTIMALASLCCGEIWSRIVCWFNLPIRLLWLAGLFQVPGGGDLVALTMLMTVVADVFSAEERGTAMFRLSAMSFVAEIVATPLGATMVKSNPWTPYMLGIVIMIFGSMFVVVMPETLNQMGVRDGIQDESTEDSDERSTLSMAKNETITQIVVAQAQEFISSSKFLWTSPRVLISIIAVFAGSLDRSSGSLLVQYVSAKFHWTIAEASYLISVRGCMTLATLLIVLPILSSFLTRLLHYDPVTKDLSIARLAAISGVLGYFLTFIASTTPLLLGGTLFMSFSIPFVWSVVTVATSFVPSQNQIATLYAAMSVSKSVGSVVAGPIFASLYGVGMQLGLEWSGLPFAVGSIIFFLALIPVVCMRAQARAGEGS